MKYKVEIQSFEVLDKDELKTAINNHCPVCGAWLYCDTIKMEGTCAIHGLFKLDVET